METKDEWQSANIKLIHQRYIDNDSALQYQPKGLSGAKDAPLAEALLESPGFSRTKIEVERFIKQHSSTLEGLSTEQGLKEKRRCTFRLGLKVSGVFIRSPDNHEQERRF